LTSFSHNLCVHIAALNPRTVNVVSSSLKSEATQDDPEEPALLKQEFLYQEGTVEQALSHLEKLSGFRLQIQDFVRWKLGEGMTRQQTDLADEVQKLLKRHGWPVVSVIFYYDVCAE